MFFAFLLHLTGKPAVTRAEHLAKIEVPRLFLQGSKDALAQLDLLQQTVENLGECATLELIANADHAFHVPARTGHKDSDVLATALDAAVSWMGAVA